MALGQPRVGAQCRWGSLGFSSCGPRGAGACWAQGSDLSQIG